jgi:four helix bundle protein
MKEKENHFRFENLNVYQKSLDYIDFTYELTSCFPRWEMFELGKQFRRAANSVALNIGEGERGTDKEFINFLRIAHRSVSECLVCTTVACRRKYLNEVQAQKSRALLAEIARMISSLSATIQRRL